MHKKLKAIHLTCYILLIGLFSPISSTESSEKIKERPFYPSFKSIPPQIEFSFIEACSNNSHTPLSTAVKELVAGINEEFFGEDFIQKIAEAEIRKFDGEYIDSWPNGQIKIKAFFKKGKVDGHVHGWFEDGKEAFKGFFNEEKKIGIHMAFYPSSDAKRYTDRSYIRLLTYNKDGKLHGKQFAEYPDGHLKVLANYINGILDGCSILYGEKRGQKHLVYKQGNLIEGSTCIHQNY